MWGFWAGWSHRGCIYLLKGRLPYISLVASRLSVQIKKLWKSKPTMISPRKKQLGMPGIAKHWKKSQRRIVRWHSHPLKHYQQRTKSNLKLKLRQLQRPKRTAPFWKVRNKPTGIWLKDAALVAISLMKGNDNLANCTMLAAVPSIDRSQWLGPHLLKTRQKILQQKLCLLLCLGTHLHWQDMHDKDPPQLPARMTNALMQHVAHP